MNDPPALETFFSKPPVCVYIFVAFNIFFCLYGASLILMTYQLLGWFTDVLFVQTASTV